MKVIDFTAIVEKAWKAYDPHTPIRTITDISAKVSTNHVYKIKLQGRKPVIAKLSFFGRYGHFKEDHTIINYMRKKLPPPYKNFLAQSLQKNKQLFTYRDQSLEHDVWVVFYKPIKIKYKLPRRLNTSHISMLGEELARFHLACDAIADELPTSSKTLQSDIIDLYKLLGTSEGQYEYHGHIDFIKRQCEIFLNELKRPEFDSLRKIPVFVDWNIGNFSIDEQGRFFSRWDYDWFRICSRVLDFYFFSRVVSDVGDRTIFSYYMDTLMEDRFLFFLQHYHRIYPLSVAEIWFIKEAYRFFILNYVVKYGKHFFHSMYASKLQKEAYALYLPQIDKKFRPERILKALNL
ncbi:MAG: hypothetical protein D6730_23110 [Bacteroidetes bacterium]|nr:MAG: hypothetical protein D6730_23110 [Bacteroidota bacterium]